MTILFPKLAFQALAYCIPPIILLSPDYSPVEHPYASAILVLAALSAALGFSMIYPTYRSPDTLILYEHLIYTVQVFRLLAIGEIIPSEQTIPRTPANEFTNPCFAYSPFSHPGNSKFLHCTLPPLPPHLRPIQLNLPRVYQDLGGRPGTRLLPDLPRGSLRMARPGAVYGAGPVPLGSDNSRRSNKGIMPSDIATDRV